MYMLVKVRFPALETDRCHSRLTGAVEEKSLKVAFVAWRCLSFIRRSDMSAWKIDTYSNRAYLNDWQPGPQDGSFALENTQPSNTLKNTRAKRATLNYCSKFFVSILSNHWPAWRVAWFSKKGGKIQSQLASLFGIAKLIKMWRNWLSNHKVKCVCFWSKEKSLK